jgi:L-ascorbate metabolism protein UlaG (beta-lactamase superfamily)
LPRSLDLADADPVPPGRLDLRFIGHATVLLDFPSARVLTDPFLRSRLGPLQRHGPLPSPAELGGVNVVLISHAHPDHFDPASLAAIPGRPTLVVPRGLGPAARWAARGQVIELVVGEQVAIGPLTITAVPARHWMTPGGPGAHPLGFIIESGLSVWFAGDTARFEEMRRLAGHVDLAMLPVWTWGPHLGPGHLGPRSAAGVLGEIRPAFAVPIHWGTLYPRRLHRIWKAPLLEPGERFAMHAAILAPSVDVRVLRPGEATRVALG